MRKSLEYGGTHEWNGKGTIASYSQFVPFPTMFSNDFHPYRQKLLLHGTMTNSIIE